MNVEKSLLTADQLQELQVWEELFASGGWQLVVRRFGERLVGLDSKFRAARGAQQLGRAQAELDLLQEVVNLEQFVEAAFGSVADETELTRQEDLQSQYSQA